MCRLIHILCLLLCTSLVAAPLSQVHAHVSGEDHDHVSVHGGHSHALTYDAHGAHEHAPSDEGHTDHPLDHAADHESSSHAIDLSAEAVKPPAGVKVLVWTAVFCAMLLAIPALMASSTMRPPPRTRARAPSPYPHPLPLLRGPPRTN